MNNICRVNNIISFSLAVEEHIHSPNYCPRAIIDVHFQSPREYNPFPLIHHYPIPLCFQVYPRCHSPTIPPICQLLPILTDYPTQAPLNFTLPKLIILLALREITSQIWS